MNRNYTTLLERLNIFVREYYKNQILRGTIYSLIGLALTLIVFAIIEHYGFFNGLIRTILFWTYLFTAAIVCIWFILRPLLKMLNLTGTITHQEAAKIIGKHFSDVSDKLTNILELNDIDSGNYEIIQASINQKIKEIELTPFQRAVDWKKTLNYSKYLLIPLGIILTLFLSGNKIVISESTHRIINYNNEFIKPAPFYFKLDSDTIDVIEKDNINLILEIYGEERPKEVFINYNNNIKKLKKLAIDQYSHKFKNVQTDISFYFSANNELSQEYNIRVLSRPEIQSYALTISPPKYTNTSTQKLKNLGTISIPEGSLVNWKIKTLQTDSIIFNINDQNTPTNKVQDNNYSVSKRIYVDTEYAISLANEHVNFTDTTFYNIKVLKDSPPSIQIVANKEPEVNKSLISGVIHDDYGFSSLVFYSEIIGNTSVIIDTIAINNDLTSQSFIYSLDLITAQAQAGQKIKCYLKVSDNDKINGFKTTTSELIIINMPTREEIKNEFADKTDDVKKSIESEIDILADLKKELIDFEKILIEKDSLDWRDKKRLDEILQKQKAFESKITELKKETKENFEKLNASTNPTEEMIKKQQQLEKLFNEIMPEEIKSLYEELNKLKDELNKDDLQKKIKDLQLSNEDLEKELDRNLEILKQVEFEQQLDDVISQLEILSKEQLNLSLDSLNNKERLDQQQKHLNQFEKIQQEIQKLKELNQNLENKQDLLDTKTQEDEINKELKEGFNQLEKKSKKRASKTQKKTAQNLMELADLFSQMKKENDKTKSYEDMEALRQILENLVYFSFEEENILLSFQEINKNNPQYIDLMHKQQDLRDASSIIEDSLFALSKRVPQISSKVNREINAIDQKTISAIDHLRERETLKAVQDQQFVMTSANNLAVMLSGILESMQEEMASDLPSTQECEKPGKGSPKPGDLKKMQEELNKHMENLKKQLEKGETNNMQKGEQSKQLVEMLAKQELIRNSLEDLRKEMQNKDAMNKLNNTINEMQKTEKDIANKKITYESLNRQKQIVTKLIEIENAMREQGEDERRESKTNLTEFERIIQEIQHKYELEKLRQNEMLKTQPPNINRFYQEKVDQYFNKMLQ